MRAQQCPQHWGGNEPWSAGEHAECIVASWSGKEGFQIGSDERFAGPELHEVREVTEVCTIRFSCGCSANMLKVRRFGDIMFLASCFRKVVPHADAASRAEAAFIASLKPARIPQPEAA